MKVRNGRDDGSTGHVTACGRRVRIQLSFFLKIGTAKLHEMEMERPAGHVIAFRLGISAEPERDPGVGFSTGVDSWPACWSHPTSKH